MTNISKKSLPVRHLVAYAHTFSEIDLLDLSRIQKNKAKQLFSFIAGLHSVYASTPFDGVSISSKELKKRFGNNYRKIIGKLVSVNLMFVNNKYSKEKSICKNYQPLISAGLEVESFLATPTKICSQEKASIKILKKLKVTLSVSEIITESEKLAAKKKIEISVNEDVTHQFVSLNFKGVFKNYAKKDALKYAYDHGLDLINYKGSKCIIANQKDYLAKREAQTAFAYASGLFKIKNKDLYASRNETNRRLDTNITTLKSDLLRFVRLDNEPLINIDLSNSQFVFYSKLVKGEKWNSNQTCLFNASASKGQLYEFIQEIYSLNSNKSISRNEAKQMMFLICFGRDFGINDKNEKRAWFAKKFPEITKNINDYKIANGYKAFPILLQNMEASLFIDVVLKKLLSKNFKCLSKHDSIITIPSQKTKVAEIVIEELNKYFGENNYHLKVEIDKKH